MGNVEDDFYASDSFYARLDRDATRLLSILIDHQEEWKPFMEVAGGRGGAIRLPVVLLPHVAS